MLTPEVVEHAQARASRPLDPAELRRAAVRAGAPVASSPADRAAAELLGELDVGEVDRWLERIAGSDDPRRERFAQLAAAA